MNTPFKVYLWSSVLLPELGLPCPPGFLLVALGCIDLGHRGSACARDCLSMSLASGLEALGGRK